MKLPPVFTCFRGNGWWFVEAPAQDHLQAPFRAFLTDEEFARATAPACEVDTHAACELLRQAGITAQRAPKEG